MTVWTICIPPSKTYIPPHHPILIKVMGMPTIVHFDLPADDVERAKKFYEKLFDWKFDKVPMPTPYYLIETADLEGNPAVRGGMGKRGMPEQKISRI